MGEGTRAMAMEPKPGSAWLHQRRGGTYRVLGHAGVQVDGALADGDAVVVYQGEDGNLWCRPPSEFMDGRFEPTPISRAAVREGEPVSLDVFQDALTHAPEGMKPRAVLAYAMRLEQGGWEDTAAQGFADAERADAVIHTMQRFGFDVQRVTPAQAAAEAHREGSDEAFKLLRDYERWELAPLVPAAPREAEGVVVPAEGHLCLTQDAAGSFRLARTYLDIQPGGAEAKRVWVQEFTLTPFEAVRWWDLPTTTPPPAATDGAAEEVGRAARDSLAIVDDDTLGDPITRLAMIGDTLYAALTPRPSGAADWPPVSTEPAHENQTPEEGDHG